ncbi:hypothetical protein OPIT5_10260 [Opitutaceae bacterium TAV5]|nr:hypothetical protein OPIT5_10260 [Opitutaceae bacterium TAV5]
MNTKSTHASKSLLRAASLILAALSGATVVHAVTPVTTGWTLVNSGDGGWTLTDAVESSQGWDLSYYGGTDPYANNNRIDSATTQGVSVTAGNYYFRGLNLSGATAYRGTGKFFEGVTLQSGTYTVTFDVGTFSASYALTSTAVIGVNLLATSTGDGNLWNDRITTGITATLAPLPGVGATSWIYTFMIDDTTTTAGGASVIGSTAGFVIRANLPNNQSFTFDNLTLTYTPAAIPEPATTAMLGGLGVLLLVAGMRFARCRR